MKSHKKANDAIFTSFREAFNFDPELEHDFDSKTIFDSLFKENEQEPSEKFQDYCNNFEALSIIQLKKSFYHFYINIQQESNEVFLKEKELLSTQKTTIKDVLRSLDISIAHIIDRYLLEILAYIRSVLYKNLGIKLFDVQLIAGIKLYRKKILEIKTGEGKTFIIPIAATLYGLRAKLLNRFIDEYNNMFKNGSDSNKSSWGKLEPFDIFQVKIVTANDYLARRDYSMLHSFYNFFNLTCYYIQETTDNSHNEKYYDFDILFCTCSHLCHLNLRDMLMRIGQLPYLPSINYVSILDEVDQILLDEALTPHIISNTIDHKTYEIDIVYQAHKFAKILSQNNYLWSINKNRDRLYCSPPGEYYFRKIFNDFIEKNRIVWQNWKGSELEDLELLYNEYKNGKVDIQDFCDQISKNYLLNDFLYVLVESSENFIRNYVPFLLQLISFRFEIIVSRENKAAVPVESYGKIFYEHNTADFAKDIRDTLIQFALKNSDPSYILSILELISCLPSYHPTKNQKTAVLFFNNLINYVWRFFNDYYLMTDPLGDKPYKDGELFPELYNTAFINIPKINTYLQERQFFEAQNLFYFKIDSALRFTRVKSGHLELHETLVEMLFDESILDKYLDEKLDKLTELRNIASPALMSSITDIFLLTFTAPIAYLVYKSCEKLDNYEFEQKSRLLELGQDFIEEILASGNIMDRILHLEEGLKTFIQDLDDCMAEGEINAPKNVAKIIHELKLEIEIVIKNQEGQDISELMSMLKNFSASLTQISDLKQFKQSFLKKIFLLIKVFSKGLIKEEFTKPQYEVIFLLISSIFELLSVNISDKLFEEYVYDDDISRKKILTYLNANEFLRRVSREFVTERIINPFKPIEYMIPEYKMGEITNIVLYLIGESTLKSALSPMEQKHSWIFGAPFYTVLSSDEDLKRRYLKGAARMACDQYYQDLEYYNLTKDSTPNTFFLLTQRNYSVVSFYEREVDYIVSNIDKEVEPNKIIFDPYRNASEEKQIQIIDNITGRTRVNNRWSDNIHSAVEAKENLLVRGESRSTAQVTPQTFFAGFWHLMGLSGTTIVAKKEFQKKFALEVEYIPTNRKINRQELKGKVFVKDLALLQEIAMDVLGIHYSIGAPALVILEKISHCDFLNDKILSVEKKVKFFNNKIHTYCKEAGIDVEMLLDVKAYAEVWNTCFNSGFETAYFEGWPSFFNLDSNQMDFKELYKIMEALEDIAVEDYRSDMLDCTFLNLCFRHFNRQTNVKKKIRKLTGKPQDLTRESEIIKNAGDLGNILIATRVAGRGTDIKLEKPELGLYMFIFNHQESKRHDQQIYGRCGRQGDNGIYRFYNSSESGLLKNIYKQLERSGNNSKELPSLYKIFSLGLNNSDDGISQILAEQTKHIQTTFEQNAHMHRDFEKKLGDIAYNYEKKLSENRWIHPAKLIKDFSLRYQAYHKEWKYELLSQPYQSFLSLLVILFRQGVDRPILSKLFNDTLYSTFYDNIKGDDHFRFLQELTIVLDETINYINNLYSGSSGKHMLTDSLSNLEIADFDAFFINRLKLLLDLEINDPDSNNILNVFNEEEFEKSKMNKIMELSFKEMEYKIRNEYLIIYNRYVELFKSNHSFSIWDFKQENIQQKFEDGSSTVSNQLSRLNLLISYRVIHAIGQIFSNTRQNNQSVKRFLHNFFILKNRKTPIEQINENVYQMVIRALDLPLNASQFNEG